jgi:hypothetical protein
MHNDREVEFTWERARLFDYDSCLAFYKYQIMNTESLKLEQTN